VAANTRRGPAAPAPAGQAQPRAAHPRQSSPWAAPAAASHKSNSAPRPICTATTSARSSAARSTPFSASAQARSRPPRPLSELVAVRARHESEWGRLGLYRPSPVARTDDRR